jgi:hypothetical protein
MDYTMNNRHSTATIEQPAETITSLEPEEQESLLARVAKLNYRNGLIALSNKVRERLELEGKLNQKADEILEDLKKTREEIAADDYRL